MGFLGKGSALVGTAELEVGISAKEICAAGGGADPGTTCSLLSGTETGKFSALVCVMHWLPCPEDDWEKTARA